ncbi:hypothetical protein VDG1235_1220 [Verrucomicrobiia bacterium DG1235]|nr:hypothetical protein VDG1235_1220 [Verrucomicrobiae bacterium DG1235]
MKPFAPEISYHRGHNGTARHELKYLVPADWVDDIRCFAQPFCRADGEAAGDPPEYRITTLQLDTLDHSLHSAKEREFLNRFKLRVRSYGEMGSAPAFLEIKRKLEDRVVKSRCRLEPGVFGVGFSLDSPVLERASERDRDTYWEFVRLVREMDARPKMLIRYIRESWVGHRSSSQRITFDRALEYAVTDRWSLEAPVVWRRMDSAFAFNVSFAPVILELKCSGSLPDWMQQLVRFFSLSRRGICKYSTAVRLESLFEGNRFSDASENTNYG